MQRKFLLLLIIFSASALSFNCQTTDEKARACKFLSFAEAEKILGGKVELVLNSWTFTKDVTRFDCTYRAVEKDETSGKDINLYFSFEQEDQNAAVEKAREVFASAYRKINEPEIFVGKLSGIGDEAFLISNPPNFHFMMVRKDTKIFRIKLNKASKGTSLEELKAFSKKVMEQF